jgi:uncharacterized membrane protein HdeD (DUF308 family)
MKLNVASAHISAAVATATSLVALIHPGFHVPTAMGATVASVATLVAGAIELVHLLGHRTAAQNLLFASQIVKQATAQATAEATSVAK